MNMVKQVKSESRMCLKKGDGYRAFKMTAGRADTSDGAIGDQAFLS